ncbi:MAG: cytidylate kinase-like family protein [Chloroflexota bacterium]|nr:cytidylate kinase-like family protein [Chloroflexota bacterium]
MTVITISRQYGSGGTEIAIRVSELLGYRFVDKEIIAAAATESGLCIEGEVEFREQGSDVRSFLERLLFPGPPTVAQVAVHGKDEEGRTTITVEELDKTECQALIRGAIHAVYSEGNTVILGRGGQGVLQDMPGVFHVRIIAPLPARLLTIQEQDHLDLESAYRKAQRHDRRTGNYLEEVFEIDWDDPLLYHLVINTEKLDLDEAAQIIVCAVERQ